MRGFGFVIPDNAKDSPEDVFIPKHLTEDAVDGDQVEIAINLDSKSGKGPEGRVLKVIKRSKTHIAGIVTKIEENQALAHVPILGDTRPVTIKIGSGEKLLVGDRVQLKVLEWGDHKASTVCEVSQKIGHIDDPSIDIQASVEEFGLHQKFPNQVLEEAKQFGNEVSKEDLKGRLDLTGSTTVTIDPETAKDFDDALSIEVDARGHYFVGVHIADVAHYVKTGSALDTEAFQRSNSTYFPGKCIPMLPEELSNNLCSLREGVIRLTVSVLIEFDSSGKTISSQVKRTYIKSRKRFTYGEAKEVLEGKKKSPYKKELDLMVRLCLLLKKKRSERGSIDFSLPELILIIDDKGVPTGVKVEEYDITHQLVEEFMLKANELVAENLLKKGKTPLFRIHEEPEAENLEEFFATARALGFALPPKPTQKDVQTLFDEAKNTPFNQQLAIGFVRNLKLALYSPHNVGHYGLALEHYCHFTSPIRRYSDLIIQRLLFNEEPKELNLEEIGKSCSDKERVSFKAESSVKALKKLRLLNQWQAENPDRNYVAHITKIKPFGIFFEVQDLFLEGYIHISDLEGDYYVYDPDRSLFAGEKTGKKFVVGMEIKVHPILIDLTYLETKWLPVGKSGNLGRGGKGNRSNSGRKPQRENRSARPPKKEKSARSNPKKGKSSSTNRRRKK